MAVTTASRRFWRNSPYGRLSGDVQAVQAQLKRDLLHELEARFAEQCPHRRGTNTVDFARPHPAAPGIVLAKDEMGETARPRSDHRGQKASPRAEHAHRRGERGLPDSECG